MNSVGALGHDRDGSGASRHAWPLEARCTVLWGADRLLVRGCVHVPDFMMSDCDEDLMSVLLAEVGDGDARTCPRQHRAVPHSCV